MDINKKPCKATVSRVGLFSFSPIRYRLRF